MGYYIETDARKGKVNYIRSNHGAVPITIEAAELYLTVIE